MSSRDEILWSPEALRNPHLAADKARRIRTMFDAIAPRYDLVNHVISFGQSGRWRKKLADRIDRCVAEPEKILDLCCGTGAMLKQLARRHPKALAVGGDFSSGMLSEIKGRYPCVAADGLQLPFSSGSFDLVTCVFGLRNLQSPERGLEEIYRVLRPGGAVGFLEFQRPSGTIGRAIFNVYFDHVLPRIGSALTRSSKTRAYEYLSQSVSSWYDGENLLEWMRRIGLGSIEVQSCCFDAVRAITAIKDLRQDKP